MPEIEDDFGYADSGSFEDTTKVLGPIRHSSKDNWRCRVCGYWPNVDSRSPFCISCGRTYYGEPGHIPDAKQLAIDELSKKMKG